MSARRFKQVDVFTTQPYRGNPVAVILDAERLRTADMQQIAAWTNLSETTFVLQPTQAGADYRLRIFGPTAEYPFAGHPTLGSAHAVLESGLVRPKAGRMVRETRRTGRNLESPGRPRRVVRRHAANTRVAVLPHAQSLASRDADEWREGADSISEMIFLAAELQLVRLCSTDHVEAQGNCHD